MKKDSWNPEQYEKFKNERSQPFFDLLSMVEKGGVHRAVDLGCGSGELTQALLAISDHVTGIDNSAQMLEKSNALVSDRLSFKTQAIESFQEPGRYDLIFSNAALQWCDHHPEILKRLRESLTPTGQLAIQMPMNHDYPSHVLAGEIAKRPEYSSFLKVDEAGLKVRSLLKPEEYAALLYRLGFKRQEVKLKVYTHILESRELVIEWVKGTMLTYYQSAFPKEVYERFLQDFRQELFKVLPDEKPFFYPFKRLLLWASLKER